MIVWTIQHNSAYEHLKKDGILRADKDYLFCGDEFPYAYDWMAEKMNGAGLIPPQGVQYPIWAWYQWEGKRKRCDLREGGYAKRGEKMVQLTVEIDDQDVMLSDFDLFHYPINQWFLPLDEKDDLEFERLYRSLGFSYQDLSNFEIQTEDMKQLRSKIAASWERIFLLDKEDNGWLYGKKENKSIQAVFWELRLEQVCKAEVFTAK